MVKSKRFLIGIAIGTLLFGIFFGTKLAESTNDYEILCIQDWYDGELHWYFTAGIHPQWFGKATLYPKRFIVDHTESDPFRLRFADAAHADMYLSVEFEYPKNGQSMTEIYRSFNGSHQIVVDNLIEKSITRCTYTTGPTMTSQESFAEKRNEIHVRVQDQMERGVYQTTQREVKTIDILTGEEKTTTVVDIVVDKNGNFARQEEGQLGKFGFGIYNFTVASIKYDAAVEAQIQQQRKLIMEVQVAMAQSKQAEQRELTTAAEGRANAAKAKWEQETEKAKMVTIAERMRDVQALDTERAGLYKSEQILIGQGDGERKRLVMLADGALQQKLKTYAEVQQMWANAFKDFKGQMVPQMVMGSNGATPTTGNSVEQLVTLLTAKTAKDLSLDLSVNK